MGFYGPQNSKTDVSLVDAAIRYIREGWNAQAFLLLSEARAGKEPAACFALGLCHFRAGELPAAIASFEQALQLLKGEPAPPRLKPRHYTRRKCRLKPCAHH